MPEQPAKLLPLPENWSRALAVAAHPDDLEYGAASAITLSFPISSPPLSSY